MKKTLKARTHRHSPADRHHFFVSSAAQWKVGYDVASLIAAMKRDGYPFNVWLVPGDKETSYKIEVYAPQVEGAVWIGFYGFGTE